jgi:hypothetical protein
MQPLRKTWLALVIGFGLLAVLLWVGVLGWALYHAVLVLL